MPSFFFQAEDGIRDIGVTGVQTCALPISLFRVRGLAFLAVLGPGFITANVDNDPGGILTYSQAGRSEERRVGKESRSGGPPEQQKKEKIRHDAGAEEGMGTVAQCTRNPQQ